MEDNWVKPSHPFGFEINNKIREKKAIVLDLIKRSYSFNKNLDFGPFFRTLTAAKYKVTNFCSYLFKPLQRLT